MRKIIGYLQIFIFFLFGFWLISFKFNSETSFNDVYWIAGVLYLILGVLLFKAGIKYNWFTVVNVDSKKEFNDFSLYTKPLIFLLGLFYLTRSTYRLHNIDALLPFIVLIVPLATTVGYGGYLFQSTSNPLQFKGSVYRVLLIPMLYLGISFMMCNLLISGNYALPSILNESRTFILSDNDCETKYISVKTSQGVKNLYNANQPQSISCEKATKVTVGLRMNDLGIDYYSDFEYIE